MASLKIHTGIYTWLFRNQHLLRPNLSLIQFCTNHLQSFQYTEKEGDLFSCPPTDALAHCVSTDCAMGKGIAVLFKKKFGSVQELKDQGKKTGDVAILKRESRFVYYLTTKDRYFNKPTYNTLTSSLTAMKKHCVANNVECVSMPKIGCGLDGLHWGKVSTILKDVFADTNISITVYTL